VPLIVVEDESLDPCDVRLLGAPAIAVRLHDRADLVEKPRFRLHNWHERIGHLSTLLPGKDTSSRPREMGVRYTIHTYGLCVNDYSLTDGCRERTHGPARMDHSQGRRKL